MHVTYSKHYFDDPQGHIWLDKDGACTIQLHGAASMSQGELDRYGAIMARALAQDGAISPSAKGRNNLADVSVYAHHSDVHDGVNIEIDAPAGTRITVQLNDGDLADVVVPE